ncbi:hypothetical protein FEM48_Zijuj06G0089300 [Ziziphus jujuba var. spinosa]|uniref:Floral homeotic protein DEFICIENS-like n=1 Tax=Ziziphus jujuba var. spinosa TaxID=714518 RepID=A0A978V8C1_ZIZJJ|nr:hypothetical protein FEM48_Zijuj06G0089300 [Ziziphus jujuba var. spinosa]
MVPTLRKRFSSKVQTKSKRTIFALGKKKKKRKEMARGKIQIKRIENTTNRQVTYSKRRNGLFKKANELTILCDAKVSILMLSSTGKLHEFISPSTTTKQIYDQYQRSEGVDLWNSHYERMQENLKKLKEVNRSLRKQIRQRMGDCLNELSFKELLGLEQDMEEAVKVIRERKDAREDDPHYGLVDNRGDYESVIGYSTEIVPRMFALRLQPNQPNLHSGTGSDLIAYPLLE